MMRGYTVKLSREGGPEERRMVYVVDDDERVLDLVCACLENAGYAAQRFSNPQAALAAFRSAETKPGLLIVDYSMPGMNGFELLGRCRASLATLKAICITGVLMMEEIERNDIRPDLMLRKPFAYRDLIKAVDRLLGA